MIQIFPGCTSDLLDDQAKKFAFRVKHGFGDSSDKNPSKNPNEKGTKGIGYKYDEKKHKCLNELGEEGYNEELGECSKIKRMLL